MASPEYLQEAERALHRMLPTSVVRQIRHAAASRAGGRLSRPKAWAPGLLEQAGLEGLGRHHLAKVDEKVLWALHGRLHDLAAKGPKEMLPKLQLAHARVAEALGSKHTLVHDLDFSGRSPHDLEDLTKANYCGAPPFEKTKAMTPECKAAAHDDIHRAWTIKTGGYPKKAPPLHQPLPHAAWVAHGHVRGIVSGSAGAEGWHAVVSQDAKGDHKVYGLAKLGASRPLSWAEFGMLSGDHKVSKRAAKKRWPGLSGFHYRKVEQALPLVEPRPYVKHRGEVQVVKGTEAANTFAEPFGPLQDHHAHMLLRAHKQVFEAMKAAGGAPEGQDFLSEIDDAGPGDGFPVPFSPTPDDNKDVMGGITPSAIPGPAIDHFDKPEPGIPPFAQRKRGFNALQVHVNKPLPNLSVAYRKSGLEDLLPPKAEREHEVHMEGFQPDKLMDHPRAFHLVHQQVLSRLSAPAMAKRGHNIEGHIMWVIPHSEEANMGEFKALYHEARVGDLHVFTNYDPAELKSPGGDIRKMAPRVDMRFLWKAMDKQIVYGIVMEPHAVDTQGDFTTPDVIEQTAHTWLAHYRIIGEQHGKVARQTEVVESYIAPMDLKLGGQTVPKGSWILGTHVIDSSLWKDIRDGKYTGYSIGGYGQSKPATEQDMMRLKRADGVLI